MKATISNHVVGPPSIPLSLRRLNLPNHYVVFSIFTTHKWYGRRNFLVRPSIRSGGGYGRNTVLNRTTSSLPSSSWDDIDDKLLPSPSSGKIAATYLDEQDVVTFLHPPKHLIPLDPSSFNPAAYLWKKVEDIPEERRHRLLSLLTPNLISRAWEIAGTRYEDSKLAKKSASSLVSDEDGATSLELWNCRTTGGPIPIAWINFFKKAIFCSEDGNTYGRLIGGSVFSGISNSLFPLYFKARQLNEIMSTEQPCDLAYEFGDGLFDIHDYPQGFPKAAKHPWPFNDQVVIYVRHLGPGILVGQAWQEGEALQQVPKKLCGEILMVKDYNASGLLQ